MKIWDRISGYLDQEPIFVRSIYAGSLLEDFFVSAVAAVLAIRLYLIATGYGQLAFGPLHIAHLTWGGLFMLAALMILFGTLNRRAQTVAAIVGSARCRNGASATSATGAQRTSSIPASAASMARFASG